MNILLFTDSGLEHRAIYKPEQRRVVKAKFVMKTSVQYVHRDHCGCRQKDSSFLSSQLINFFTFSLHCIDIITAVITSIYHT